ncbi:MAG: 3-mercaptopyruvate sulfurtransferase [Myxococcales bacterium]|nr:3-mercaptopyruvate sulfurtransferase [Myxococcales bacterium]
MTSALVSPAWLLDHLADPDLRILDGSWYLPSAQRDPRAEFAAAHIPGARYFDIDEVADRSTALPHMLPTPNAFAGHAAALGVSNHHHVVVYDGAGVITSPRVWWTFRGFGHVRVSVLQGGLPAWRAAGHPLTNEVPTSVPMRYQPRLRPELVRSLAQMRASAALGTPQVVDARSAGRFRGTAPEPRPGVRSGRMPNSLNLPYEDLLTPQGALREPDELRAAFLAAGVDLAAPAVTTCGSGVTAAILALALFELGAPEASLYDGSWAEWGGRDDTEILTG